MKLPTGLTRMEQETYFRTNAADKEWDFYTRDPKFKRWLEKRGYDVVEDHQGSWSCKIALNRITFRKRVQIKPTTPRKSPFLRRSLDEIGNSSNKLSPDVVTVVLPSDVDEVPF